MSWPNTTSFCAAYVGRGSAVRYVLLAAVVGDGTESFLLGASSDLEKARCSCTNRIGITGEHHSILPSLTIRLLGTIRGREPGVWGSYVDRVVGTWDHKGETCLWAVNVSALKVMEIR